MCGAANAFDGTITVHGNITANACAIKVNNGTADGVVTLPTISSAALSQAGKTAGQTPFSISLSGCTGATLNNARTYFEFGSMVDAATGRLNTAAGAGTAENVQIELLNADLAPIRAGAVIQNDTPVSIASGAGVMNYSARYFATNAVVPGTVSTFVNYTVVYD
ncbi:fimbrial protein [Diaphorobacter aerolatus]|uniref:fimbrial protein n=1 Tax=Diaphorobacter aerolatus TaxID=1288495 RepID=UPI001D02558C|nr:fimbrial protein [Diaphorobacter aerolatus]